MRILLLYEYFNHNQLLDNLGKEIAKTNNFVSSFNIVKFRYTNYNKENRPIWILLLHILIAIPKVRGGLLRWIRKWTILKLAGSYNIIDIHYFSVFYDELIPILKARGKKIKITVWGSDFYRVDQKRKEEQRLLYRQVDIIQLETEQVKDQFLQDFPEFKAKIRVAHFGNIQLTHLDKILNDNCKMECKQNIGIPIDKLVITCGTNGSIGHQHELLLNKISELPQQLKDNIFLLIPMNYGGSAEYIKLVIKKASKLNIPYRVITGFMSTKEFSNYIIASDIIITIQISDTFSAAIQEYLFASNVLLAGKWLPYQVFTDNNVYFKIVDLENLEDTLKDTIISVDKYRQLGVKNPVNIFKLSSWSGVIENWLSIYNEIKIA
nr:hypothetical protein [uncultured Carboxylicivirga sp.]